MRRANRIKMMAGIVIALLLFNQFFRTGERTLSAREASIILGGEPGEYYDACCAYIPECDPAPANAEPCVGRTEAECTGGEYEEQHNTAPHAKCYVLVNPPATAFCQEWVPDPEADPPELPAVCKTTWNCQWYGEFECVSTGPSMTDGAPHWCFDYCIP